MATTATIPEPLWTTEQVAQLLSRTPRAVRQMAFNRRLPSVRIPRTKGYLFEPSAVKSFLASCAVDVAPEAN